MHENGGIHRACMHNTLAPQAGRISWEPDEVAQQQRSDAVAVWSSLRDPQRLLRRDTQYNGHGEFKAYSRVTKFQ